MTKRVEERPQPFGGEAANQVARRFAVLALWPAGAAISQRGSRAVGLESVRCRVETCRGRHRPERDRDASVSHPAHRDLTCLNLRKKG